MKPRTTQALALLPLLFTLSGCGLFTKHGLVVTSSPESGGAVELSPPGGSYRKGEVVTLTAVPATDYAFFGYAGDLTSAEATATLTMDEDKSVTAVFSTDAWVTTVDPAGSGTVDVAVLTPARGAFPVTPGDVLELTAQPAAGWEFLAWTGNLTGVENPATLTVSDVFSVTATFGPIYDDVTAADTYGGAGSEGFLLDTTGRADVTYTLDLGGATRNVTFVFTNTGEAAADYPRVSEVTGSFGARVVPPPPRLLGGASSRPAALRDHPLVNAFSAQAAEVLRSSPRVSPRTLIPQPPRRDVFGGTESFVYDLSNRTVAATCKKVVEVSPVSLLIYVADAWWDADKVTQPMVDAVADAFLVTGQDNDIYDWITAIFGEEWGAHDYTDLIAYDGSITILLFDIDGDGDDFLNLGGISGYYWSKDNVKGVGYSNERVMFYLDAPMLRTMDEPTWEITDYWPQDQISTLAHEFQHMIHYYQKDVLLGGTDPYGSYAWLNEMCSLVAEDLVSDKLHLPGPRGVDPDAFTTGTAGDPGNYEGRLPQYNYENTTPVAYWPPETATNYTYLSSYAVNYAFGAYLARNFGGAGLFRLIVQNPYVGREAVEEGLSQAGFATESFASTLRKWGIANLLSDDTTAADGLVYNTGGWISAEVDGKAYALGSIDLYNYDFGTAQGTQSGPRVRSAIPTSGRQGASSSYYYLAAGGATGELTWQIRLEQDTRLEVVVKEP